MRLPGKRCFVLPTAEVLALALLLYYVNNESSVLLFVLCLSVSALFVVTVWLLLESNRRLYSRKALRDCFIEHLYKIIYYRARGGSYFKALESASRHTDNERLRVATSQASRKQRMGGDFMEHVESLEELRDYAPISDSSGDPADAVRSYNFYARAKRSEMEQATQRYATFNMFVSTVLPSFLIFAFVGNAILAGSDFGILSFSFLVLLIIPLVYSLGNTLMRRRLLV